MKKKKKRKKKINITNYNYLLNKKKPNTFTLFAINNFNNHYNRVFVALTKKESNNLSFN